MRVRILTSAIAAAFALPVLVAPAATAAAPTAVPSVVTSVPAAPLPEAKKEYLLSSKEIANVTGTKGKLKVDGKPTAVNNSNGSFGAARYSGISNVNRPALFEVGYISFSEPTSTDMVCQQLVQQNGAKITFSGESTCDFEGNRVNNKYQYVSLTNMGDGIYVYGIAVLPRADKKNYGTVYSLKALNLAKAQELKLKKYGFGTQY